MLEERNRLGASEVDDGRNGRLTGTPEFPIDEVEGGGAEKSKEGNPGGEGRFDVLAFRRDEDEGVNEERPRWEGREGVEKVAREGVGIR